MIKCLTIIQIELEFGNAGFLRRGENRSTRRKTSRSKEENQQQTQPTHESNPGHMGGRRASAFTTAPSLLPKVLFYSGQSCLVGWDFLCSVGENRFRLVWLINFFNRVQTSLWNVWQSTGSNLPRFNRKRLKNCSIEKGQSSNWLRLGRLIPKEGDLRISLCYRYIPVQ